jgi:hypothetical protein
MNNGYRRGARRVDRQLLAKGELHGGLVLAAAEQSGATSNA